MHTQYTKNTENFQHVLDIWWVVGVATCKRRSPSIFLYVILPIENKTNSKTDEMIIQTMSLFISPKVTSAITYDNAIYKPNNLLQLKSKHIVE